MLIKNSPKHTILLVITSALFLFASTVVHANTLITTTGQTGASGTNWSSSVIGNTLTITTTGSANINQSVINDALTSGRNVVLVTTNNSIDLQTGVAISNTGSTAVRLTLKSIGFIYMAPNVSIRSTNRPMDIILWADHNDSQKFNTATTDEIYLREGVTIDSNGGQIVLAGGLDDGKNGGIAGDGIPDNYAYRGAGDYLGGVNLGLSGGTGTVVSLLSSGGDITIRGWSRNNTSNARPGIVSQGKLKIDAGAGKIDIKGISSVQNGIEFAWGATPDIAITSSYSGTDPAIRIAGGAENSGIGLYLVNNNAGNFLIQSTSSTGGGVLLQGQNGTSNDNTAITLLNSNSNTNLQILSGTGNIVLENSQVDAILGTSQGIIQNFGSIRYGARANTTAVQGITPAVASSNANIIFRGKNIQFETGTPITTVASTGAFSVEPLEAENSFTSGINFRNVDLATLTNVALGKGSNTANLTVASDITVNGPISIMGGVVDLNGEINTSAGNGDILLKGQTSIAATGSDRTLSSGSGDITLTTNNLTNATPKVVIESTGTFTMEPFGTAFSSYGEQFDLSGSLTSNDFIGSGDANGLRINNLNQLTGLVFGKEGNNTGFMTYTDWMVNGPISFIGRHMRVSGGNVTSAASGASLIFKVLREISVEANRSIQTNNGDLIFWADSDANGGHITINAGASISTQGGDLVLAGGLDDGSNGGIAGDGIPDGFAWRTTADPDFGGLSLGEGGIASPALVSLLSDGGNIILRGKTSDASDHPGLLTQEALVIDAGSGTIDLNGTSSTGHGIELGFGSTAHDIAIRSASNLATAISIQGSTTAAGKGGFFNLSSGSSLIQSEGTGGITISGASTLHEGMVLDNLQILSASGKISLTGTGPSRGQLLRNTDLGLRSSATAIQGITPLATSSADVDLIANSILFVTSANTIASTGMLRILPSGDAFDSALTLGTHFDPGVNLTGLVVGKDRATAANLTLGKAITNAGPISVYGGIITVNEDIISTASGADILLEGSRITQGAGVTVQTDAGNITYAVTDSPWTAALDSAISIGATSGTQAVINAQGGGISLTSSFATNGTNNSSGSNFDIALNVANAEIKTSGAGHITLNGDAYNNASTIADYVWGIVLRDDTVIQTDTGAISISGRGGKSYGNARGVVSNGTNLQVLSNSGTITFTDTKPDVNGSYGGMYIKPSSANAIKIGADGPTVVSSNSNLIFNVDRITFDTPATSLDTSGAVTIQPVGDDFTGSVSLANLSITNAAGLTVGKSATSADGTNDAAVSLGGATIAGPISVYGSTLSVNGALTATSSDINLHATSTVTQTAPITADRLSLNGTGNFTLQNSSNNVNVIAGGDSATRLGNVAYRDANALEIGSTNPSGIFSSGTVLIETETGDLTLSQSINTTSSSDDAIILNAGRASSAGTASGGNIIVSNSPTLTYASGGRAKLYSGVEIKSTGLTTLAGGATQARYGFDEVSSPAAPNLVDDETYAIYRFAGGNITIVSSGGGTEGTDWIYSNGVISALTSPVSILNTDIESKFSSGHVSLEANQVIFDADITNPTANNFSVLSRTRILHTNTVNSPVTNITTQGGHVLLAANVDDLADGESTTNGYIHFRNGLAISTNGGDITLGGGDVLGSGYAVGRVDNDEETEGVRIDDKLLINSGGGDIAIRGKSSNRNLAVTGFGNSGFGIYDLDSPGLIDSGTGTITIEGINQNPNVTDYSSGIVFALNSNHAVTIRSANTTANAIAISASATGPNVDNYGLEVEINSPLNIAATGVGGGVSLALAQSATTSDKYDLVVRAPLEILANGGPINIAGSADGIWLQNANAYIASKANSDVSASTSEVTIEFDRYNLVSNPDVATTGAVTVQPVSNSFWPNDPSAGVQTSWFDWNQNSQTMSELTVGKPGNVRNIIHSADLTAAGPISIYGGFVNINANLTSTDTGDIFIKSLSNNNPSVDLQSGKTITKTSGTGTLTMQAQGRVENNGAITASGSGQLNVVLWSDFNNTNNDGGVTHSGSIATNGGHVWMGGSSSNAGQLTWNGLTVGDGPSIGTGSYNNNALDFYGPVTTSGGDFFAWAGDGAQAINLGVHSSSSGVIDTGSGEVTIVADQTSLGPTISTTGQINLVPNGGSYTSALGWTTSTTSGNLEVTAGHYDGLRINSIVNVGGLAIGSYSGLTDGNSDPVVFGNTSNVTLNSPLTVAGPIEVHGGTITMSANVETTAAAANILLKASGSIFQSTTSSSITTTTNGGSAIYWADSDGNGEGRIDLVNNTSISTNGGGIWLGGGSGTTTWEPYAGATPITVGDGSANSGTSAAWGINLDRATLNAGTGNLWLSGVSTGTTGPYQIGTRIYASSSSSSISTGLTGNNITINGTGSAASGTLSDHWGVAVIAQSNASTFIDAGGTLAVTGIGGGSATSGGNGRNHGLYLERSILTSVGDMTLTGTGGGSASSGPDNDGITLNNGATIRSGAGSLTLIGARGLQAGSEALSLNAPDNNTNVLGHATQTGNILLQVDNYSTWLGTNGTGINQILGTGTLTIEPSQGATSFVSAIDTSGLTLGSALTGLTVGKSGNTAYMTFGRAAAIAGPIEIYAGGIAINAATTAASNDIKLHATGTVSQSAAITANRLSLNGTGSFTLQNTSNDVNTIAGGSTSARLGAVSYFNADDVTIGTVNPTGIYSSGDVLIETATGNINLTEPINTTSTTNTTTGYAGAIVLNAGKSAGLGSAAGGDIIVSGNGAVTSGGINKLYSGSDEASTGLTTLAGQSNARDLVDETTTTFNPVLTGNATYALYRSGPLGEGDLTIVASGGAAENSGWVYNNGVLATTQATVNVNASDVVAKVGLGNLTIEANNITVDAPVSWNNTNALTLQAIKNIVVGADDELISAGGNISLLAGQSIGLSQSTTWANRSVINANGGNIIIQAISGAFDVGRVVSLAFVEIKTSGTGTISITGDGTNSTRSAQSSWGVSFDGVASRSLIQSEHGAINIVGVGGGVSVNSRGIVADSRDFQILSATGAITLRDQRPSTCTSCGYGGIYFNPSTNDGTGIVFGSDGTTVLSGASTESSSTITIQADRFFTELGTSTVRTTGTMTLEPANAIFEASQTFPGALSLTSDVSGLTLGKAGNTSGIEIQSALTINGPITLYGQDTTVSAALEATNARLRFVAAAADDLNGTVSNTAAGTITADELLIENVHRVLLSTHSNVSIDTLASQGGHRILLRNTAPLEIGSVGGVSGISASEFVVIETTTGDLTVTEPVASSLSSGTSITLNAGKDKSVGDDTGGDILISGDGAINIEPGAVAKLYSGSPANSTGLAPEADVALVFYDETDQPPSSAFTAGNAYAIYRETSPSQLSIETQPAITAASSVAFATQPKVAIEDAFGNVIRTDSTSKIQAQIFSGDNGTLLGTQEVTVTNGEATFSDLALLGPVGGTYRLRFTSLGLFAVASDNITITDPGPVDLTVSTITADPVGNLTADGTETSVLAVTVTDSYGNPIPSESVVLTLNDDTGRTLGADTGTTNAIGQIATTLASTVAGTTTVSAYLNSEAPANLMGSVGVGFLAGEPAKLQMISGNGQTGEVAQALANPLNVRVRDAQDNIVEGASVVFAGDGTTTPSSGVAVSDATGLAQITWTLGELAGNQSLTATLAGSDPAVTVSFVATADPGPPAQFGVVPASPKQLTTIPFALDVVLQDAYGNTTVADSNLTVALTDNNTSFVASLPGANDGDLEIDQTSGPISQTLTAGQDTIALPAVVYSGLSAPDVETPDIELIATATLNSQTLTGQALISARDIKLSMTAAPSEITADGIESSLLTTTLLDLQDAAVPNQAVRFENTAGVLIDATTLQPLPDPVVIQGDANGQAQVRLRAGTVMQTAKVTAISRGADPASVNIELKAGAADIATSLVTANPTSIVANGVAESTITVQLVDANGNLTDRLPTGQALTLASSNGTLQGSLSDEGNGLYTQKLKAPTAVGSSDLTASIGSTAITDQATVNFVADVPSQIQIVGGNNQQATVDKALANAITVKVTDAQGNAISNTDINFQGSGSTTPADGVVTTDAQGLASINWRLGTTRGVQTLTATLVSDPLIQADIQASAQADVASSIRITEQPVAQVNAATLTTQPVAELLDQFGNRVVQDNQTSISAALLSGSSLALSGTTTATASNGLITFTNLIVTGPLNTADRIRFSGPGLAAAVSDPIALTQAGAMDVTASTLTATPQGNLIANGQSASTLLIQAVDVSGNAVVGETIVFSASGGRLSATQGQTNAQGQLAVQLTSTEAGAVTISAYRQSVASANLLGQTTLGFVSDAPAKLEIISGNNQQAVVGTSLTQPLKVRVLDAGNNTVANASVVFAGAGTTVPADGVVISDANGLAEVSWTLPEKAGTAVMQAQLAGTTPLVAQSLTATAQAGEPSKLLVRVNDPRQLTTIPFDVLVTLADRFGNVVTDDEALEIQLVATNQSAAAQVPDAREGDLYRAGLTNNVVTAALPSGQASVVVEDVIYDGLSAPSLENPDVAVQAIVAGKNIAGQTVIAARDVKLDGEAAPAEIVADGQSTTRITFTLSDLDGNPIPNQAVSIDNTQGTLLSTQQQVLTVPAVLVTDANGELLVDLRASELITEAVVTGRRQGASPAPVSVAFTKPRDAAAVNKLIGFDPDSEDPDVSNPPTLDDYTDAGVDKAKEENVDAYNSAIGNLDLTIEEIEKMVESYNQLLEEAGTGTATLTEEDFANLGITITDPVQLSLLNSIIGLLDAETLKDHDVLLEIATVVEKLMAWVQGQQVSPALTLADLELIGITGVDPETLAVVLAALFDHPDGLLAIPSIGAVQALVDAALIDQATGDLIGFDPDSEDPTVSAPPTLESYIDAGITEAKEANVAAYNAALSNLDLTPEGIAEMVNAYNALLEQASQGDVQLTSDEFAALGIDVTDAQSLALLNSILSSKSPNALMDHDALLAMAQAMQALLAWMQGLSTSHGLTLADLELLGITGINADEFEALMALLANHPDAGSVDSLALLQGLVDGALSEMRALPVPVNPSWAIGLLMALMWWLGLSHSIRSRVSG